MRNLILAVVVTAALVSCSKPSQIPPTHDELRANTIYSKVIEPDGTEKTFITFQPYSNTRMACTYMHGSASNVNCTSY